jgi:hypothetical protein
MRSCIVRGVLVAAPVPHRVRWPVWLRTMLQDGPHQRSVTPPEQLRYHVLRHLVSDEHRHQAGVHLGLSRQCGPEGAGCGHAHPGNA